MFDRDMTVHQSGDAISRIMPAMRDDVKLTDVFDMVTLIGYYTMNIVVNIL